MRSVMSSPVGCRNRTSPSSSRIGCIAKSTIRSVPSATQYASVSRNTSPDRAFVVASRMRACIASEPRHQGVSQNGLPSTSSRV